MPPFTKGGGPAGPGDFLFRKSRCPTGPGILSCCLTPFGKGNPQSAALTDPFAKGAFSHARGAHAPFRKRGWPQGRGGFPPLPCALWKEKSSVSFADSSFCERHLFPHKRSPLPPFAKGGGPAGPGDFPLSQNGGPAGLGGFPPLPCALWKGKSSVSCADSSFCERSLFSRKRR